MGWRDGHGQELQVCGHLPTEVFKAMRANEIPERTEA